MLTAIINVSLHQGFAPEVLRERITVMAYGEDSTQLPDGEELVVFEDSEWPEVVSRPDPREASLDLRRQAVQTPPVHRPPIATT